MRQDSFLKNGCKYNPISWYQDNHDISWQSLDYFAYFIILLYTSIWLITAAAKQSSKVKETSEANSSEVRSSNPGFDPNASEDKKRNPSLKQDAHKARLSSFDLEPNGSEDKTISPRLKPDASKVRASGPGLDHGILSTHQSHFTVETSGAGPGQLTVRVRGPKGRMHQKNRKDVFLTSIHILISE